MSFPESKFTNAGQYAQVYFEQLGTAGSTVRGDSLQQAADALVTAHRAGRSVFSCGNGGSAAIANHLVCDHCKLVQTDTDLTPRIHSLCATVEIITAIANDLSYDDIFAYQLRSLARPGDVLITISSSGDSENIVRAVEWAKESGVRTIAMTGFSGGRSARIADISLHVASGNYGIIEDVHQALMHILAQFIRQAHMDEELIAQRKF